MSKKNKDGSGEQTAVTDNIECELPEVEVNTPDAELQFAEAADETGRDITSFDDTFLENISVDSNVEKVAKRTKLPETVVKYIMGIVYIVLGTVCAVLYKQIETVLPYVIGGCLGVFAILRFIFAMIEKEYVHTYSNKTASSIILLGVSIMIIVEHDWARDFIPTVWGVWGLFEGAHAFNHALSRIVRKKRFVYYLLKGIVEVVIAFLLLYGDLHIGNMHIGELHIMIFGISLILDGIIVLPFIHKFLTRR